MDARTLNLADFFSGHDTDPLLAPPEFTEWQRATRVEQGLFRVPMASAAGPRTRIVTENGFTEVLNLGSLDYLGLNRHPEVVRAVKAAVERWGTGACGVPMLTGTCEPLQEVERAVSEMTGREAATVFSSGFAGGVGIMSALLRRGDVAIADEKTHICWIDGIRQSGARLVTFPHGDLKALDAALAQHASARRLVVVDALYSMDGDVADLPATLDVCDAHGVGLVVDEAHSMFALGEGGGGVAEMQGVSGRVRLGFGTFSKALSQIGGFAVGDRDLVEYMRLYAHPFVFSAALPPAVLVGIATAIEVARRDQERRERLAANAAYFRAGVRAMGIDTGASSTHIVPIIVGANRDLLYDGGLAMMARGLYIVPIDYPAVSEDALRFRAAVTAAHTKDDLDEALQIIEDEIAVPLRRSGG